MAPYAASVAQTPMEILVTMYRQTEQLQGLTAKIKKVERIDDKLITQVSDVKLKLHPYQVYIKQQAPKEGIEVMAFKNPKGKKAVVNLNSFPWITVYLDPYGSLMRRHQHHLVFDSGFDLMVRILKHELSASLDAGRLVKEQDTTWQQRPVYKLTLTNADYKLINYTVLPHETVDDIANKLFVNAYSIVAFNKEVDGYTDVSEGQVIQVPSHYAQSMTLLIDKETFMPVVIRVYDTRGLYEKYEYNNLQLNPAFPANAFSEDNPEYGF